MSDSSLDGLLLMLSQATCYRLLLCTAFKTTLKKDRPVARGNHAEGGSHRRDCPIMDMPVRRRRYKDKARLRHDSFDKQRCHEVISHNNMKDSTRQYRDESASATQTYKSREATVFDESVVCLVLFLKIHVHTQP